jgi:hypothetical protein
MKAEWRRQQAGGFAFGSQIRFCRALAGIFEQIRFGVEKVTLKRPSVHEQMNHSLRTRRKVGGPGGCRPGFRVPGLSSKSRSYTHRASTGPEVQRQLTAR